MPFGASLNEAFQTYDIEYGTPSITGVGGMSGGGLNGGLHGHGNLRPGMSGGCQGGCGKPAPHYLVNGPGRLAGQVGGGLGGNLGGQIGANSGFGGSGPLGLGGARTRSSVIGSLAGGANGDGVESSTADIRNVVSSPFSRNIDVGSDAPDLATNFEVGDFDSDRNQFLVNVENVDTPVNQKVTPDVQRTAMPKDVEPACTDAKCVEILNHLMRCGGCRNRLNDLLNINRNTFLGIDFSKIDYQKVLFYIIIAIVVIAFYELFNMLLGKRGGLTSSY